MNIYKLKRLMKRLFTPVTIMLIPHSSRRPLRAKMPSIGIMFSLAVCITAVLYIFSVAVDALQYRLMQERLNYYRGQFHELKSTILALKKTEIQFKRLFSLGSRDKVLENYNPSDSGAIDMEALKEQVKGTVNGVAEIRDYLSRQRDLYMATPKGWPVAGRIASGFGNRIHPMLEGRDYHTGLDISIAAGQPVRATADGMVRYSGWSGGSGNLIVIEHGFGYSTCYAHNRINVVRAGQTIRRGDIIAYVGSTGIATGPHLHYEIWKRGEAVNPLPFVEGRS